jgi:RNA recognition motif-containing protein
MYMCSLHQTSEDELTKVFSKYGSVSSVNLKQKETITFAFVEFGSTSEAEEAINE